MRPEAAPGNRGWERTPLAFRPVPRGSWGAQHNSDRLVYAKLTSMNSPHDNSQGASQGKHASASRRSFAQEHAQEQQGAGPADAAEQGVRQQLRDISEVAAVEVIVTSAVHLMSAAAVKCGLGHEENAEQLKDLDEARKLITALAGFVTAAAPEIGSQHAGPLRDGLRSLQLAFREASIIPDPPGQGPGEKYTGPVN